MIQASAARGGRPVTLAEVEGATAGTLRATA